MAARKLNWTREQFAEVYGYLANPRTAVLIEIQVPPTRQTEFESEYLRWTGDTPPLEGESGYSVLAHTSDKRSMQKRVIFTPAGTPPQQLVDIVQNDAKLDKWRVSRNLLVDAMLKRGFRMGESPSADEVRDQLESDQHAAFQLGYHRAEH